MKTSNHWKPPWLCRIFGHQWKITEIIVEGGIENFIRMPVALYICKRCDAASHASLSGYKYFSPQTLERFLNELEAIDDGKLIPLDSKR